MKLYKVEEYRPTSSGCGCSGCGSVVFVVVVVLVLGVLYIGKGLPGPFAIFLAIFMAVAIWGAIRFFQS